MPRHFRIHPAIGVARMGKPKGKTNRDGDTSTEATSSLNSGTGDIVSLRTLFRHLFRLGQDFASVAT